MPLEHLKDRHALVVDLPRVYPRHTQPLPARHGRLHTLTPEAQTAALIQQAEAAMGSAALKTLTVTGRGSGASVGQAYAPGMAWPGLHLTALSRSMNFEAASFRSEDVV